MKKILAVLFLVFVLCLSGCSKKAATYMSYSDFEAKWKDADWNAFLKDSSEFAEDYAAVTRYFYKLAEQGESPMTGWVRDKQTETSTKPLTLFGREMELSGTREVITDTSKGHFNAEVSEKYELSGLSFYGTKEECYAFSKALAEYIMKIRPEKDMENYFRFGSDFELQEEDFKKLIEESTEPDFFFCTYGANYLQPGESEKFKFNTKNTLSSHVGFYLSLDDEYYSAFTLFK